MEQYSSLSKLSFIFFVIASPFFFVIASEAWQPQRGLITRRLLVQIQLL
jgi:hypothetical protein